jgi:hypothetical protein
MPAGTASLLPQRQPIITGVALMEGRSGYRPTQGTSVPGWRSPHASLSHLDGPLPPILVTPCYPQEIAIPHPPQHFDHQCQPLDAHRLPRLTIPIATVTAAVQSNKVYPPRINTALRFNLIRAADKRYSLALRKRMRDAYDIHARHKTLRLAHGKGRMVCASRSD